MKKILLTLFLLTCGLLVNNVLAQLSTANGDYTKPGIKYVVIWSAHHKLSADRPNLYGQFPLYEFDKEYTLSFTSKAEASAFMTGFTAAMSSTGTLTTLGSPKIIIINTTEDK